MYQIRTHTHDTSGWQHVALTPWSRTQRDACRPRRHGSHGSFKIPLRWRRQQQRQRSSGHAGGREVLAPEMHYSIHIDDLYHACISSVFCCISDDSWMYLSLSEALKCYIRDTFWIMRRIHSNTCDGIIQIHMLDALSRHTVLGKPFIHTNQFKRLTRGIVYLLCMVRAAQASPDSVGFG